MAGHVKWYDATKGFGFIVDPQGRSDILLHANVLRRFGLNSVGEGIEITVLVSRTPKGAQAIEILAVGDNGRPGTGLTDLEGLSAEEIRALPVVPARVKRFDRTRGFGFANVFGSADDVFIHIEVMREGGFSDLRQGEAICLRLIAGKRGPMAVAVMPWEAGLPLA
ncbi:Cold shock DNA-binding domain protein [Ketogulonicigenium vulgare WSH-001]|uniref:Cold shock DNA-binding domain protein n=2 Tax=Ketogulonicigenium vulgare TaxID=92945 RepID=F9Y3U4_KETVW|nr:cold shock domain-containing protein [Ketogulonicigenium vulgare]AEM40458.1 Cold shock DNA-binding domain protein [Ketogulonicigenium vulgare WSH-001]